MQRTQQTIAHSVGEPVMRMTAAACGSWASCRADASSGWSVTTAIAPCDNSAHSILRL